MFKQLEKRRNRDYQRCGVRMKSLFWLGGLLWLSACSSAQHDIYFPQGQREEMGLRAFRLCGHENYTVLQEGQAGPYDRALIECGEPPR